MRLSGCASTQLADNSKCSYHAAEKLSIDQQRDTMDAITLLHTRNSSAKLTEPAPQGDALNNILQAALRAPDHARLRPWRFLMIEGAARNDLGALFVEAASRRCENIGEAAMSNEQLEKIAAKALRAPLIVVVIATIKQHPKVPAIEQVLSAGCAAHGILLAAHALGFAGIWRTGANAFDKTVMQGLGLADNEQIVSFIYLGSAAGKSKPVSELSVSEFYQPWSATGAD